MKQYSVKQRTQDLLLEARPKGDLAANKGTVQIAILFHI